MFELLTTQEMAKADSLTIERGTPGIVLMENAGAGVVEHVLEEFPDHHEFLVLCGPGNNGGDGFVAARHLLEDDLFVQVLSVCDLESYKGDAREMAEQWEEDVSPLTPETLADAIKDKNPDDFLIIDALFGAGLSRPIEGELAQCFDLINVSGLPVVSIDVPSGIDGNSGQELGISLQAEMTVTFFRYKPGHFLYPGRKLCGDVKMIDIGIKRNVLDDIKPSCFINDLYLWRDRFPKLEVEEHKYNRGHSVVISGKVNQTGAARMGAKAALTVGSGLVTVFSPEDALLVNACHLTAIMLEGFNSSEDISKLLQDSRKNSILIGPGAGVAEGTASNVMACLESNAHITLDADALTSFENQADVLFDAIRSNSSRTVVMTPHDGEFSRLFGNDTKIAGKISKTEKAKNAAIQSGAVVVLKGPDTVIASPDGRIAINENGCRWLATAGSGDVLAGIITGLLAQGMSGFEAACAAVWMHSESGRLFGPGLIAEDISDQIPEIMDIILG